MEINNHKHDWKYEEIKEATFGVVFGVIRRCECGVVEFSNYCEGRSGGPWRPMRKPIKKNELP